jgi:vesicle transport through interaction with t-SNAREs 1
MSGPLDTDPGSELFAGYEAELKLLQANITQQLDRIPELSAEPRKAAVRRAEGDVEEADELVSLTI